eukprot:Phypoly_transcript_05827.p1 GENE.Phypoly_transcript_05827~~Phypoly_transcript_05827.p1  ORF type:complete len:583 (+),score=77.83 Phypoly_transcript_05827:116-1864(+)
MPHYHMGSLQIGNLLVLLFLVACGSLLVDCAQINYVPTAECATHKGCNFNSHIWDSSTPPTAADDVLIISEVPITIFVNGEDVTLNSLTIAKNVYLKFLNWSQVSIGNEQDTISFTFFGPNCSLLVESSSLSVIGVQGRDLEVYNSTITATVGSISMETAKIFLSDINANFDIYFRTLISNDTVINSSSIQTEFIVADVTLFETLELQVGNATISNSILHLPVLLFSPNGTLEIIDCETIIETLTINVNSVLIFSTSSHNNAEINTISYDFSLGHFEVHILDNMTFTLASGPIYTLYLGSQVTMNLQNDWVSIYNVRQIPESYATISTSGFLQIHNDTTFFGSINILPNGLFVVNSTMTIVPQNSVSISGNGTLQVYGDLLCPGHQIAVGKVEWNSGRITAASVSTPAMQVAKLATGEMNGNVEIINSGNLNLHGPLVINGSFSQVRGTQNFTVTSSIPATTAYLQVNGDLKIDSPAISASVTGENSGEKKWLLVSSPQPPLSLSFSNYYMEQALAVVNRGGNVYLEIRNQGFWAKNYIYVVIGMSVILAVLVGAGIVYYQRRRSKRKHYEELQEPTEEDLR